MPAGDSIYHLGPLSGRACLGSPPLLAREVIIRGDE